jgi:hypothetical protein
MKAPGNPRRDWSGFALSQLFALALFAGCLWWVVRQVGFVFANHRILASLSLQEQLGSALARQLLAFALAAWLVHALLGALAFALARLTESAFRDRSPPRRELLIAGWFMLLAGLALAANDAWHPSSIFAGEESWWRGEIAGFARIHAAFAAFALVVAVMLVRARQRLRMSRAPVAASLAIALLVACTLLIQPRFPEATAKVAGQSPHVVIIGIDSLRNDLQVPRRGPAATPHVAAFLGEARRFRDATTPLARTYPSWMSILTGRHPVTTNVRYNLMPRRLVNEGETLGDALRWRGYRTIYATDEVRFANFDRTFGFDELITPPIGAVDFVLGFAGDLPLVNLAASTPLGGALFPSNHATRQPRRERHLPATALHAAARARARDRGPVLPRDPPDARPLALCLGRATGADRARALSRCLWRGRRGGRQAIRRSARAARAQGRARQCDRRAALGSRRGARRRR